MVPQSQNAGCHPHVILRSFDCEASLQAASRHPGKSPANKVTSPLQADDNPRQTRSLCFTKG